MTTPDDLAGLAARESQPVPIGIADIIGKWPGDETDEQIAEAMRAELAKGESS